MMKLFTSALLFLLANHLLAQVDPSLALFRELKSRDSLLFEIGFNTCDISQFENLVSEDFEFYHDQAGVTASKADFVAGIRDGLCKLSYRARRELVKGSLLVYPLKKNGVLYGALQMGKHRFFALEKDKPEYFTSIALFTHLWILENGEWKLLRGLSYDHQTKESAVPSLKDKKTAKTKHH
jgi:hypothetical protein